MSVEKRYAAELRVGPAEAGDEMSLVGYAAKFNLPSKDLGGFKEIIAPGAFTRALADPQTDVRCLFNHSADRVLGRQAAGTLVLKQDDTGLWFRCILDPNNTEHRNLHSSVKRGDINECSFAFTPNGPEGDHWEDRKDETGKYFISRTLKDVNLFDVSAVTNPAYNNTSVAARSEAVTPEIRSIMSEIVKKRALGTDLATGKDSFEEYCRELCAALSDKFPADAEAVAGSYCGPASGKYYVCDTYTDCVIACECETGEYVRIPYIEDGSDNYVFGTPVEVEKTWVPSDRSKSIQNERRALKAAHMQAIADQHKAEEKARTEAAAAHAAAASEHTDAAVAHATAAAAAQAEADRMAKCEASQGDCSVKGCRCQNQMVAARDIDDAFDFGDDDDWDYDAHTDEENAQHDEDKAERSLKAKTEMRAADAKVLTKTVDGKALPASAFALVGDPKDTSTWKLPVHDKAHADNAAARLNQTKDIPEAKKAAVEAKIASAQKKFGETDADKAARSLTEAAARSAEKEDLELRFRLAMSKLLL